MAMSVPAAGGDDEEEVIGAINTTPLVDVMLVMLIIFLITVPVVINVVQLQLPVVSNIPVVIKPENIVISVREDGAVWLQQTEMSDREELRARLKERVLEAVNAGKPIPIVHIRGDKKAKFKDIGPVIVDVQRANILQIAFTTEPDAPAGR